ncbi:hypothetical protein EJ04DRAFT_57365 [Polyplosphaeria fusca]|uniref:HTH TFE/IIEalpha-type domain-containing protein n=1 Tax=Polyplosphaeria fusca TaxID=682080 RepID=A0A9P4UYJ9_9PLEO|nr:hypothetical protein EJ04DRAFT_57365 [Polyplosphaeria fusca]
MDPLQLAKTFVKTVVRIFYSVEQIVVVDALVFHGALVLSDLVLVLDAGKNSKHAQKITAKLREGGLISVHTRQELRDGALKSSGRDYYYIDYRHAIDATKYRLHMLDEKVKREAKPSAEKKEFACPRCKSQWTAMEVLDNMDPLGRESGFLCRTCNAPLKSIEDNTREPEADDTPAKFNKFFAPLLKLMQQIDDVTVPATDAEETINAAVELPRDKDLNPAARHELVEPTTSRPAAVKGNTIIKKDIQVDIASHSEAAEAARRLEQERLQKIAQQNSLPDWHTKSTVTNTGYAAGVLNTSALNGVDTPLAKAEPADEKKNNETNLDDVFAALEEEQRRKDEAEADEDEEEDDDDDFEDVVGGGLEPVNPDSKRVKLESSAAPSPAGATPASNVAGGAGDESDEDEFEDV